MSNSSHPESIPWVVVARSQDVHLDRALGIQAWGERYVLFRNEDGQICGTDGHCAHRSASLEGAKVECGEVVCPYHGWRFDGAGRCTAIPGEAKTSHVRPLGVPSVYEKDGLVWLAPQPKTDIFPCPDFSNPRTWRRNEMSFRFPAPWIWVLENMLDFSHVPFAHAKSAGKGRMPTSPRQAIESIVDSGGRTTGVRSDYRLHNEGFRFARVLSPLLRTLRGFGRDFEIGVRSTFTWPGYVANYLRLENGAEYRMHFFLCPRSDSSTGLVFVTERNFLRNSLFSRFERELVRRLFSEDIAIAKQTAFERLERRYSSRNDAHFLAVLKMIERDGAALPGLRPTAERRHCEAPPVVCPSDSQ